MGTAGYAAPEQFGFQQTDGRTDIYALGILMNVLLTGQFPQQDFYDKIPFSNVIDRCIQIDATNR